MHWSQNEKRHRRYRDQRWWRSVFLHELSCMTVWEMTAVTIGAGGVFQQWRGRRWSGWSDMQVDCTRDLNHVHASSSFIFVWTTVEIMMLFFSFSLLIGFDMFSISSIFLKVHVGTILENFLKVGLAYLQLCLLAWKVKLCWTCLHIKNYFF